MSNIEDDLKIVKRYLRNSSYKESDSDFFKNGGWEMVDLEIPKAMANVLSEREQDKARIKELEAKLEFKKYGDLDEIEFEEYMSHFIPKQKVKDNLKEEQERFEVYKKECETNENLKFGMWKHLGAKNMCEKILGIEKNIATLD